MAEIYVQATKWVRYEKNDDEGDKSTQEDENVNESQRRTLTSSLLNADVIE